MSTVTKVVSTDSQLVQLLREVGGSPVAISRDAISALAQPGALQPPLLVVDLRDDPRFPPALALLKRQHPATAVLLVLRGLDPALMLEAMRAGVTECVVDPLSLPDLKAAMGRLVAATEAPTRGEVYAFIGAKGGVGATTAAVNVATALAKHTTDSTLLIDLNAASGDAAVFLGSEPRFSVVDALDNVQRLDAAFLRGLIVRCSSGLDLLGASGRPVAGSFDAVRIRTLLDVASRTHRYTVLDVPRSDMTTLDALDAATRIVLVVNQELATVRSASRMASSLRQRYGADRVWLVLARTDRRAEIGHEDVERVVGADVRHTFPSDYRTALQAMHKGRPIVLENHSDLAGAFTAFARELAGVPAPKKDKARTGNLLGLLSPGRA